MTGRACIIRQYYYELPVRREAEALRDAGFEVDVICLQEKGHKSFEIDSGVSVHRIPLNRKRGNFLRYIWDYFSFLFFSGIKVTLLHIKHPYKVIQVNTMPDFLVFASLIPHLLGAKVIAFMKEPTPELGATLYKSEMMPKVLKVIERLVLKYANAAFTVTQQLKDVYVLRGARADKISVILNAPDARHFLDLVNPSHTPDPDYFTLIYHGSVEERYGHDIVLQGVAIARKQVPNLRLRIMGTGEFVDTVIAMIKDLQLEDCVQYLGFVSRETLSEELTKADVGLVAQKSSAYSNLVHTNKMFEYMIFGKPAIVSRLKSVSTYFDDNALRYYESEDPASLAEAIVDLYQHPEKRKSLVENSLRLYEQHCWDKQREVYLGVFKKLLERK